MVKNSLQYLSSQVNKDLIKRHERNPMLEIKLTLAGSNVVFTPELDKHPERHNGLRDIVNGWIGSFLNVSTLFRRLDTEGTFTKEMHEDMDAQILLAEIMVCLW